MPAPSDPSILGVHFAAWILPLLIVVARVLDVTLGTLRVVFIARGHKHWAPVAGFFEVLIWITVIAGIVKNLDAPILYFAYATGYAIGTYVGIKIEERLALGTVVLRVITQKTAGALIGALRGRQFGVTTLDAEGAHGPVKVIFAIVRRKDLGVALGFVRQFNPKAFYTVEDLRSLGHGVFPGRPGK